MLKIHLEFDPREQLSILQLLSGFLIPEYRSLWLFKRIQLTSVFKKEYTSMNTDISQSPYAKDIDTAIANGNNLLALEITQTALEKEQDNEQLNALLISLLYEYRIPCAEQMTRFLQLFPDSLYPVRIYLADLLCSLEHFDDCASEARYYLRLIKEHYGHDFTAISHPRTLEFTLKAFLLTCTVYIAAGARSYADRGLLLAQPFATDTWFNHYKTEHVNILQDLKDEQLSVLNNKWETFFKDGSNYTELYQHCAEKGYTELAIRLRLLHESFQNNTNFCISTDEFFQVVLQDEHKNYLLG